MIKRTFSHTSRRCQVVQEKHLSTRRKGQTCVLVTIVQRRSSEGRQRKNPHEVYALSENGGELLLHPDLLHLERIEDRMGTQYSLEVNSGMHRWLDAINK